MLCQLCLEDKPLLKKSHIIPNFIYKDLFGIKHRLVNTNINNLSEKNFIQSGFYDKDILCAKCDNEIIGKLERYACNHIYKEAPARAKIKREFFQGDGENLSFVRYLNLNYENTKLFFLSILWKAHLSVNSFFEDVDLGKIYSERIRKMILSNDAGNDDEFEVVLITVATDGTRPTKSIIEPRKLRLDGNTCYIFHIHEIMYHFNVTEYNKESLYTKGAGIRKNGIMDIGIVDNDIAREYFDSFVGKTLLMKSNIRR